MVRWSDFEKKVFFEKYQIYPKLFGKIASFIPGKSASNCVKFYYCNKKMLQLKRYLRFPPFLDSMSREIFENSIITSEIGLSRRGRKRKENGFNGGGDDDQEILEESIYHQQKSNSSNPKLQILASTNWTLLEKKSFHYALKLFGKSFSKISQHLHGTKSISECKYFYRLYKKQRREKSKVAAAITTSKETPQSATTFANSGGNNNAKKFLFSHYWTKEEKKSFETGYKIYGNDWHKIASIITTKSESQTKKFFKKNQHLFKEKTKKYIEKEEAREIPNFEEPSKLPTKYAGPTTTSANTVIKLPTLF